MAGKERLNVLLKTFQAAEREAVAQRSFVDSILRKRQEKVSLKQDKFNGLNHRLEKALGTDRLRAMQAGNINLAGSCSSYGKRLKQELQFVEAELERLKKELKMAEERAQQAEQDLIEARVERKKIERLLSHQRYRGQIRDEALDAERVDELTQYQSHKFRSK